MPLQLTHADLYFPGESTKAFGRTTHLGIGAHQDDLEFMALHGILAGYQSRERGFAGVTCTDGGGSARAGRFAEYSDEQMKAVRIEEQKAAARLGEYTFMAQLKHPSSIAKEKDLRTPLVADLVAILRECHPSIIYTHNPFDKHRTHVGVLMAVLEAIRQLPLRLRPTQVLGCEVWRGLDWLPDSLKLVLPVSGHDELARQLSAVFESQIEGGKRYDLAIEGRRRANATFLESHAVDHEEAVSYAIDLTALTRDDAPPLQAWADSVLTNFRHEILDNLAGE
ncbi:PIG-L family deacetylase [Ruficoccus sp. ZRK36]|uniref:PIG-L deacetylase family protein n=1 Tax=Ruficoccus sp. ZRK36 TaxID=2866311 RepID=UPI001C72CCA9|nr:PIG-L family deacetylase [Ruficoccus sp. ZRK36]QYY35792.1 PIG-L family deacetylase [Ruficoccus sp. ZRK36]